MTRGWRPKEISSLIAGVDGYTRGWIEATDCGNGNTKVETFGSFKNLLGRKELAVIVVDVPIGLLAQGARKCDLLVRRFLGQPRASSLFPAPIRPMLVAQTWERAGRIGLQVEGKKCSKQAAGIIPKVREVDDVMSPDLQARVLEGHPEVSFAVMNGGEALTFSKLTKKGREVRLRLLARHFTDIESHLSAVPGAISDILDAYACLWTAQRVLSDCVRRFPPNARVDERGLRMEILA